jgi:hypothetical protein
MFSNKIKVLFAFEMEYLQASSDKNASKKLIRIFSINTSLLSLSFN